MPGPSFKISVLLGTGGPGIGKVLVDLFDLATSPPALVGTLITPSTGGSVGVINSSIAASWKVGPSAALTAGRYRLSFDGGTPGGSSTITVNSQTSPRVISGGTGTYSLLLQGPQHIEFTLTAANAGSPLILGDAVYVVGPAFTLTVALEGGAAIENVPVTLYDLGAAPGTLPASAAAAYGPYATNSAGTIVETLNSTDESYQLSLTSPIIVADPTANPVVVAASGTTLFLQGAQNIYFTTPPSVSAFIDLGSIVYEVGGCLLSGTVQRQLAPPASGTGPLANVGIDMVDPTTGTVLDHAVTDAQGNFCFFAGPKRSGPVTLRFPSSVTDNGDSLALAPPANQFNAYVNLNSQTQLPTLQYTLAQATVTGLVTNGAVGLQGILPMIELFYPKTGSSTTQPTNNMGYFQFLNVTPGPIELTFPGVVTDTNGETWTLQAGQSGTQSFTVVGGQALQVGVVVYQPEPHAIVWTVTTTDGKPAPGKLVEVQTSPATTPPTVVAAGVTGTDGTVTLSLAASGTYTVVVYPYPGMTGQPIQSTVSVNSVAYGSTSVPPTVPGGGGGAGGEGEAVPDLQSYPVLTEEVPAGILPTTTGPATAGPVGGTSPLGLRADSAIREVLSWRTKADDPKGFVTALNQAFDLKEVEGHTEWTWTPRSYTVQTDMGALTGAQASIYTRAKVALDQSLPLLSGLYPLVPNVEPEDLATVQAVVSTQFTALVNELGVVGGPRVPRVDELFKLLLGDVHPDAPHRRPVEIVGGSLGLVRKRFGFDRRYVTTVDDEQDLTNYYIVVDYVYGLKESWKEEKNYFIRNGVTPGFAPFFGTQLVLLSRGLDMVAQSVQDAYFAMDSVFMGDAERQISQLNFRNVTVQVPDPKTGGFDPYTFPPDTSGLFVAELLDWVNRAVSDELPRLLQDAGKDGLESLLSYMERLRKFVHAAIPAISPARRSPVTRGLPPGYHTPRVNRAMRLLADGLDETYKLAQQLTLPDQPVAVSSKELDDIRQELKKLSGQVASSPPLGRVGN